MESHGQLRVVRIYRRAGRKARILIGTVEVAGTDKKMSFSNIEELWEILRRRKGADPNAPPTPQRRLRKEAMSATGATDIEESAEGVSSRTHLRTLKGAI